MGMYTHLRLDVEIYPKYKDEVLAYIDSVPRLRCTSYYFMDQGKHFIEEDELAKAPVESGSEVTAPMCVIHADVSLKNYEGEIQSYLAFLKGKIYGTDHQGEYVGTVRYENDQIPDILLLDGDEIVQRKIQVIV